MQNVYFVSYQIFFKGELHKRLYVGDLNVYTTGNIVPSLPSIKTSIADEIGIGEENYTIHLLAVTPLGSIEE